MVSPTRDTDRSVRFSVAIVQRAVLEYRVPFYVQLREELARRGIELRLVRSAPASGYGRADEADIGWMVEHPARTLRLGGHELLWQPIGPEVRSADLVIVEQATRLVSNYALLLRRGGPLVAFWGHGRSFDTARHSSRPSEWAKRRLIGAPHWWFAYNEASAAVVRESGYPASRITVVGNSTDTRGLRERLQRVTPERAGRFREEHDLGDGPVALFLGNLSRQKRLSFLIQATDSLHATLDGFRLLIVGDGDRRSTVAEAARTRPYMRLLGHLSEDALAECFAVSSVMLVPGWAGLVVVDSFAAQVPLIASRSFPHPPEITYIRPGVDGELVDDGGSPERYAAAAREIIVDRSRRQHLITGCAETADRLSIEAMVQRFVDGVTLALGLTADGGVSPTFE
jgi:L-malate glycosyltransferase